MSSFREDVAAALRTVDECVYYGTNVEHPRERRWDYIVFSRDALRRKPNRAGFSDLVNVAVVREEYIPDGTEEAVVAAMEALPGVRLAEEDHPYYYRSKPGTRHSVEMVVLRFTHSRKS